MEIDRDKYNISERKTEYGTVVSYRPKNPKQSDIDAMNEVCSRILDRIMAKKQLNTAK